MVTLNRARTVKPAVPRQRVSRGYRVFQVVNALVLTVVVVATLYPLVNILARSFSSEGYINAGEVGLIPKGFNITTYKAVMSDPTFWTDYGNTVLYTVVGTAVSLVLTTCYAYVLSKRDLRGRTFLVGVAVFTMFFSGGLIPNYLLISSLGMRNSIWALVLPNAVSVFNLLVMKSFFEGMPTELEEAAAIDGLSTFGILLRIVLPLSKAVIATMTLFYAVSYWNSWFSAFLYLDRPNLFPVTRGIFNFYGQNESAYTVFAAAVVIASLPLVILFAATQRQLVRASIAGSVKN